jgi:hypothetical protein
MKRTEFSPALLLCLGCALLVVAGCETLPFPSRGSTEPITEQSLGEVPIVESAFPPAAASRFDDIPVPEGLTMKHANSFMFESGQLQIAYLIYEGRMMPEDAAQFFLDALPNANWTLVNVLQYNDITITLRKPDKDLVIQISPRRTRGCVARIALTPAGASR